MVELADCASAWLERKHLVLGLQHRLADGPQLLLDLPLPVAAAAAVGTMSHTPQGFRPNNDEVVERQPCFELGETLGKPRH